MYISMTIEGQISRAKAPQKLQTRKRKLVTQESRFSAEWDNRLFTKMLSGLGSVTCGAAKTWTESMARTSLPWSKPSTAQRTPSYDSYKSEKAAPSTIIHCRATEHGHFPLQPYSHVKSGAVDVK